MSFKLIDVLITPTEYKKLAAKGVLSLDIFDLLLDANPEIDAKQLSKNMKKVHQH